MKRLSFILFSLLCAGVFAACSCAPATSTIPSSAVEDSGPPPSPPGVYTSDQNPDPAVSAPASTSASGTTGSSAPADSSQVEQSAQGVIESAGMGKYYVLFSDGLSITVYMDEVDLSELKDTLPGCDVIVYYYGTLSGDPATYTVTRLVSP